MNRSIKVSSLKIAKRSRNFQFFSPFSPIQTNNLRQNCGEYYIEQLSRLNSLHPSTSKILLKHEKKWHFCVEMIEKIIPFLLSLLDKNLNFFLGKYSSALNVADHLNFLSKSKHEKGWISNLSSRTAFYINKKNVIKQCQGHSRAVPLI